MRKDITFLVLGFLPLWLLLVDLVLWFFGANTHIIDWNLNRILFGSFWCAIGWSIAPFVMD